MKRLIVIEVDPDEKTVRITDGEGKETLLESIAIFGGDTTNERLFIQMYGASADAAWAFGQGYEIARRQTANTALKNFYRQAALHCIMSAAEPGEDEPCH